MSITKESLRQLFSLPYDFSSWQSFLHDFFGASQLKTPPVMLNTSTEDETGYLLGDMETSDGYSVGLFQFDIFHSSVLRKRVGLRNLVKIYLREHYEAALVVFRETDSPAWRFSFISDLKEENTAPKRFTYIFGDANGAFHTPVSRFWALYQKRSNGTVAFKEMMDAFSVEVLTKEFYDKLFQWFTWAISADSGISFPANPKLPKESQEELSVKIIRLITRLLFVWFIKQKGLVPNELFNEESLKDILKDFSPEASDSSCYYNAILQNLFFATLNRAIVDEDGHGRRFATMKDNRDLRNLYRYAEMFAISEKEVVELFSKVPFLNGGLFECQDKFIKTGIQQEDDRYFDGFSRNSAKYSDGTYKYRAFIPNKLFFSQDEKQLGLVTLLKQYNFTIEENSPTDAVVSLDPELLGRVFENLLGAYNPETQETVRKSTGSFYTPREIVDYMVEQSLCEYLVTKCGKENEEDIRSLFSSTDQCNINEGLRNAIITSMKSIKILDPACGSGAFPMGCLLHIVDIIERLQPGIDRYALKLELLENCIYGVDIQPIAMLISKLRFFISLICEQNSIDFNDAAHNFGINTLPNLETKFVAANTLISADIRSCYLDWADKDQQKELIRLKEELLQIRHGHFHAKSQYAKQKARQQDKEKCDEIQQSILDSAANVDARRLKDAEERAAYYKEELKKYPEKWVDEIQHQGMLFDDGGPSIFKRDINKAKRDELNGYLQANLAVIKRERAKTVPTEFASAVAQVTRWNPYDQNASAPFFDSEWMFGVTSGFDVVIGNPPYIQLQSDGGKLANLYKDGGFSTFERTGDIYCLFFERGWQLLKDNGHLCFITSNKWMRAGYGASMRNFLANQTNPELLIDFAGQKIFESATVDTNILLFAKQQNEGKTLACIAKPGCREDLSGFVRQNGTRMAFTTADSWVILSPIEQSIKRKIEAVGTPLKNWDIKINRGILTGCNEAFIINESKRKELIAQDPHSAEIIRPILRGRDIKRYGYEWAHLYLIATFPSRHYNIDEFPAVKEHLLTFDRQRLLEAGLDEIANSDELLHDFCRQRLEQCGQNIIIKGNKVLIDGKAEKSRKKTGNKWFETQDQIGYWEDFSKPKIVWGNLGLSAGFAFAAEDMFVNAPCPMITPFSEFLLTVLNSRLGDWYIRHLGVTRNGGYFEYKPMFIEQLPVPMQLPSTLSDIEMRLRTCKSDRDKDDFVNGLYGLTNEEALFIFSELRD